MIARLLLAAALAPVLAASTALPAQQRAAPRDWTRSVVETAEGGYRMGNPDAPVKLVEYGSLTCSHCAHFFQDSHAPLSRMVRTGKVSFEFRSLVLNGVDVTANVIARCGGAPRFFPFTDGLYASYDAWTGKYGAMTAEQKQELRKLSEPQQMVRLAEIGGLMPVAAKAGIPTAKAKQCLGDTTIHDKLEAMRNDAIARGISGTPTLFVNDVRVDGIEWSDVEPRIRSAGG